MMPTILTIWGMVCALQGAVKSYAGLVTIRAFLGLIEGPMFPGIVLYLSGFYTRKELSLRYAHYYPIGNISQVDPLIPLGLLFSFRRHPCQVHSQVFSLLLS